MSQRSEQVSEELRKIVSMVLLHELNDPRLGFVTITRIEMTDDLRFARIFYSVLGGEKERQDTVEAIAENMAYLRQATIQRINLKYAPELRFELDRSIDESFKIDQILKKIKETEEPKE